MNKLSVVLENCYGIGKLSTDFDFSRTKTCAIYAPNGLMKTSFAKTFKDLSINKDTSDLVFPERKTKRQIIDESGNEIKPEEVFVVERYNQDYGSDRLSTLLVTKELKDDYDDAYREIEAEKNIFIKKLKSISQSSDCEHEVIQSFNKDASLFEILEQVFPLLNSKQIQYTFRYNDVFDKKGNVKKFIDKNKDLLKSYFTNYESIISKSAFFKKSSNTFGTYQAREILRSVSDNSFFEAGHLLELSNETKIKSSNELKNILEDEINKILSDKDLKNIFDKIDKEISANAELRLFKEVIEKNNFLLLELNDYIEFNKKVWLGYLDQMGQDVASLLKNFNEKKQILESIISKAKKERTDWEKSVDEFNKRFVGVPFELKIINKEDVMLKTEAPAVEFVFFDSQGKKSIKKEDLLCVLSQGECRALYLLNIIFEVEARKKIRQRTFFVIDDIADSFDYKNKYAIIQYLMDMSEVDNFFQIILTHNFDFLRTIESRNIVKYSNCFFAFKEKSEIFIKAATGGIKNPFVNDWKNDLSNNRKLISSIPFVRNIIEYTDGENDQNYKKLTSLLHWKCDSDSILVSDLKIVFESVLHNISFPSSNLSNKVLDFIFSESESCLKDPLGINFENKIILSIAIRLLAEKFMVNKINDQAFWNQISSYQTYELIKKYKTMFPTDLSNIDILEEVNLITPENIHLNSFMYEPILDLGDEHLRKLYCDVKGLKN